MNRAIFRCTLMFAVLAANGAVFGQSDAGKVCQFVITGLWKTQATTETNPIFYDFSPDGWARLRSHTADARPRDFELLAEVKYKLEAPTKPERLEFTAMGKTEVFPAGTTSMVIVDYGDDVFITLHPETGEQTKWIRTQAHRYFLTFAARREAPRQSGAAFAMLTTLDGRRAAIEALGIQLSKDQQGRTTPVFGPIPELLSNQFAAESDKASDVMIRLELSEAEFERARKVFEAWSKYAQTSSPPNGDPYLNGMEFLKSAAESLNQCSQKIELQKQDGSVSNRQNFPERLLEYISMIRKKNRELHVTDGMFPAEWRPLLLQQVQ